MDHEYIEDIAEELNIDVDSLHEILEQLDIETLQMAVPPYGEDTATAVSHQDAERLRSYVTYTRG